MKQYQDLGDGSLKIGNTVIPDDPSHRLFLKMQDEVQAGEAEVLPPVVPPPAYGMPTVQEQLDVLWGQLPATAPARAREMRDKVMNRPVPPDGGAG